MHIIKILSGTNDIRKGVSHIKPQPGECPSSVYISCTHATEYGLPGFLPLALSHTHTGFCRLSMLLYLLNTQVPVESWPHSIFRLLVYCSSSTTLTAPNHFHIHLHGASEAMLLILPTVHQPKPTVHHALRANDIMSQEFWIAFPFKVKLQWYE